MGKIGKPKPNPEIKKGQPEYELDWWIGSGTATPTIYVDVGIRLPLQPRPGPVELNFGRIFRPDLHTVYA